MTDRASELVRDAEVSRARLDLTIERLEQRLTPLGLADEAVGLVRRSASLPIVDKGLEAARRNPLPVLMIAAGAGLLAMRLMNDRNDRHSPSVAANGASRNGLAAARETVKSNAPDPIHKNPAKES